MEACDKDNLLFNDLRDLGQFMRKRLRSIGHSSTVLLLGYSHYKTKACYNL